ncbi:hypothetical protein C2S52_010124 [Perilla frutescens var. hirtella]|nr:hypothetical protein C2S52_010124 [Perilla frutescens var. hirtella]
MGGPMGLTGFFFSFGVPVVAFCADGETTGNSDSAGWTSFEERVLLEPFPSSSSSSLNGPEAAEMEHAEPSNRQWATRSPNHLLNSSELRSLTSVLRSPEHAEPSNRQWAKKVPTQHRKKEQSTICLTHAPGIPGHRGYELIFY